MGKLANFLAGFFCILAASGKLANPMENNATRARSG
jgi:hypothetical protein